MSYFEHGRETINLEIRGLEKVRDALGGSFDTAVELVLGGLKQERKIVATGVGKSLHIAQKVAATLTSTGAPSVVLDPTHAIHGDLGVLSRGDVMLAFSYSGESEELLTLLPLAKREGVMIIAVTGATDSPLGKFADAVLSVAIDREACPFNIAPTTSTTAMLAVGDAIAMTVLDARGFSEEDYARLHPAGAIGRTLLLRVADIMRTGERVASIDAQATVKDAVLAMTKARSGSAAVTDADGRLLGILTDGDLRRHLASDEERLITEQVSDVMTSSPVTIGPEQLAADVLKIFEERDIDDVLVVDAENRVLGAVDIQDLPKLKIL